jgi:hypothetical protein
LPSATGDAEIRPATPSVSSESLAVRSRHDPKVHEREVAALDRHRAGIPRSLERSTVLRGKRTVRRRLRMQGCPFMRSGLPGAAILEASTFLHLAGRGVERPLDQSSWRRRSIRCSRSTATRFRPTPGKR